LQDGRISGVERKVQLPADVERQDRPRCPCVELSQNRSVQLVELDLHIDLRRSIQLPGSMVEEQRAARGKVASAES
jgi:hypothetical protein